jgi:hypothetical protein
MTHLGLCTGSGGDVVVVAEVVVVRFGTVVGVLVVVGFGTVVGVDITSSGVVVRVVMSGVGGVGSLEPGAVTAGLDVEPADAGMSVPSGPNASRCGEHAPTMRTVPPMSAANSRAPTWPA